MYSVSFPEMLSSSRVLLYKDNEATKSNLQLLLKTYKKSLIGDPDFGTNLQKTIQATSSAILLDKVVDDIYTSITVFIPQIYVQRSDITVSCKDNLLIASIKYTSLIDYTTNLYSINLTQTDET